MCDTHIYIYDTNMCVYICIYSYTYILCIHLCIKWVFVGFVIINFLVKVYIVIHKDGMDPDLKFISIFN